METKQLWHLLNYDLDLAEKKNSSDFANTKEFWDSPIQKFTFHILIHMAAG